MSAGLIAAVLLGAGAPPEGPAASEAKRDALTRYGVAVWQVRRDRLLSAAKSLEAAARQDPDATAPLKELVRVYSQVGRDPDAIRAARRVLDKDPHDVDTAHALARLLHDAGELKEAAAAARLAAESPELADRPDKALAVYRDLAKLLDATGDPAAAADALRKAVELLTARRKVFGAVGLPVAREIDADLADTHERLGKVLVKAAKFDAAADAYRTAHALYADPARANDPGSAARLDWNLSAVFAAKGDPAEAIRHLEAFLKLRPQALDPFERLAALLRQAGRGGEVVPALRGYAAKDPKNVPLLAVLAAELARDPDARGAADELFGKLYPLTNDPKVVRAVVRSHVETGRAALVLADLDRAYEALKEKDDEPGDPEKSAFAAAKARAVADALKAEPEWANAVIRAAGEDLRQGVRRHYKTWHLTGVQAAWHHKLEVAAVQFRQAVRTAPAATEGESYVRLIDVLWKSRKPADVAAVCRDGLQRARNLLPVYFNYHLALALAELGDADEALAVAERAVKQGADAWRLDTRLGKVSVLERLGRWDDAVEVCRKLPDEFDAPADRLRIRYALAGALWGAKRYAAAEAELRAILEADPDHAGACNDLGYHLADQGRDLDEAERLVRRAIAADRADRRRSGDPEGENAAYLDTLGWVLFRKGDPAGAKAWLEKAAALPEGATDPTVWDHLGDVCFRLGDRAKAKGHWEAALALYAADARAKRDGRPDEVRRKLKRVP